MLVKRHSSLTAIPNLLEILRFSKPDSAGFYETADGGAIRGEITPHARLEKPLVGSLDH
jgi:hypothetical protein